MKVHSTPGVVALAVAVLAVSAAPASAQVGKMSVNLEALAHKAADKVDVTLDGSLLHLAAKFLSAEDPDEARVKELLQGVQGIYVHSYRFDRDAAYGDADIQAIERDLSAHGWTRMVNAQSSRERQDIGLWIRQDRARMAGLGILAREPRGLTIVNIVGEIDLDRLADLEGHFGIPRMDRKPPRR